MEKATVRSKGGIQVKGGIQIKGRSQGHEKAYVEADGDIVVQFITNANVISHQNIVVESGIVQSTVWAGGNIAVAGNDGQIVGGMVDADGDIVADIIGSDIGVETIVRLGRKLDDLEKTIRESEAEIEELEQSAEEYVVVIETLRGKTGEPTENAEEAKATSERVHVEGEQATKSLLELENDLNELKEQYRLSLKTARTVRARQSILPGTIVEIQGVRKTFLEPTGPVTIVKSGDELIALPYRETEES